MKRLLRFLAAAFFVNVWVDEGIIPYNEFVAVFR